MDGLENTHNKIRKNEKSWEKVWTCFEVLKKIKKIKTRIITVIHKENYNEIIPLMEIVKKIEQIFILLYYLEVIH